MRPQLLLIQIQKLEIQKALNALIKDRTVLVIAHRLNAILGADQIAVMEQGKIMLLERIMNF